MVKVDLVVFQDSWDSYKSPGTHTIQNFWTKTKIKIKNTTGILRSSLITPYMVLHQTLSPSPPFPVSNTFHAFHLSAALSHFLTLFNIKC